MPFGPYEYEDNDFYTYVPGEEVDVLVNTKDEKILTMVPSNANSIKSGLHEELDDTYDELVGETYDYVYARVAGSKVENTTSLEATKVEYVDKFEDKDDYVRINGTQYKDSRSSNGCEPTDDWLILSGNERVTIRDLEVGDILVEVTATFNDVKSNGDLDPQRSEKFYVIGTEEAEGELTKYVEERYTDDESNQYKVVTVDGEEYFVQKSATYVEDPEASKVKDEKFYDLNLNSDAAKKMKGENVVLKLDPIFGKVVRVEFDGKINGNEGDSSIKFFGVTSLVQDDGSRNYSVTLKNEDGEDDYTFASSSVARDIYSDVKGWLGITPDTHKVKDEIGAFVEVELNDDNEIEAMNFLAKGDPNGGSDNVKKDLRDGIQSYTYDNDKYKAEFIENAKYDDDNVSIVNAESNSHKVDVDNGVVVVTLSCDDQSDDKPNNDEYTVEFSEGLDLIDGLNGEDDVIVVYEDDGSNPPLATHVVLFDTTSDKSSYEVGIVESIEEDMIDDDQTIDINGETYTLDLNEGQNLPDEDSVIVYRIRTNSKGDELLEVVSELKTSGLKDEKQDGQNYLYVKETKDSRALINNTWENLKLNGTYADDYEDYLIVRVDANEDNNEWTFGTPETEEYSETMLSEYDRIYIDNTEEIYYIIQYPTGHEHNTTSSTIAVNIDPTNVTVSLDKHYYQIQYTATPASANITWDSSDTTKATVDENGRVELIATTTQPITISAKVNTTEKATLHLTICADTTPSFTFSSDPTTEKQQLLGKTSKELQDDITIKDGKISGLLHYVGSYDGFSANAQGNFLALNFSGIMGDDVDNWSFCFKGKPTKQFKNDGILILRITDPKTAVLELYYGTDEDKQLVQTFDLSGLELEQNNPQP